MMLKKIIMIVPVKIASALRIREINFPSYIYFIKKQHSY